MRFHLAAQINQASDDSLTAHCVYTVQYVLSAEQWRDIIGVFVYAHCTHCVAIKGR